MKYFLIFFLILQISVAQTLSISINENTYGIDQTNLIIVSQFKNIADYNDLSNYSDITIVFNGENYQFLQIPKSLRFGTKYILTKNSNEYNLFFTSLPIISINTSNNIEDEPKVSANYTYSDNEQIVNSIIGIELRGGVSQSFPKKTYDLEFWTDETGDNSQNFQFGNLRNDDDWVLDALYNEPLRIRSYIAHKLWLSIHQPYYLEDEENAKSGADVLFTELFLNNIYTGIYLLSEQIDKKLLQLKSFNGNIRGELYKGFTWGNSTYSELPNFDNNDRIWGGFEMKYPKESQITNWGNLYNYIDFAINSDNETFEGEIWSKFNKENCIDYFLFLNLIRATDNTGKNIYVAKYKTNELYFNVPWDLDGHLGTIWNGENDSTTDDILQNGLYYRLLNENPQNFNQDLRTRWFELRNDILSNLNLRNYISEAYTTLNSNNVFERESIVFPNYPFDVTSLNYMNNWLDERLIFLDNYFNILTIFDNEILSSKIYPVPSKNIVNFNFESSNLLEYSIFSIDGKLIFKDKFKKSHTININNLKIGVYFVHIENKIFKIIKI